MITASEIKSGMVVRLGGDLHKVVSCDYHAGGGKMGGVSHARFRKLGTETVLERRFHPTEKVENVELEKHVMEFLYSDQDAYYFMDVSSYDQISIGKAVIGPAAKFLIAGMRLPVSFWEGQALDINFPEVIEVKIAETVPGLRGPDLVYKPAALENGTEIMVPQFIGAGEIIRLETATGKYVERAKPKSTASTGT